MKKLSEYLLLWTMGGAIYYTFELFFRGFSHWSMFVLGGLCLVFCAQQEMDALACAALEAGGMVRDLCDRVRVHDRDHRQ